MADIYQLIYQGREESELKILEACNERSMVYGLALSREEAKELMISRNDSLKKYQRVEFGAGILDKLIDHFCDSQYVDQDSYADVLKELQDIFYGFKNESEDKVSDDELLTFMREQFDKVCFGDTQYLATTCLERFARAVRAGYGDFIENQGSGSYEALDEEERWDKDLYMEVLKDLCWS